MPFRRQVWETAKEFVAVLEEGPHNWSACVPDLPGCAVAGEARLETERLIQEAAEWHLEGTVEDGDAVPKPVYDGPVLPPKI